MKQGKRPTRRQKQAIIFAGLDPRSWVVVKNLEEELHIVHRETGRLKVITF